MKKACSGCAKQIPEAALHCVFCGAKQASNESAEATTLALQDAVDRAGESSMAISGASGEGVVIAPPAALPERAEDSASARPASFRAGVTMMGLRIEELQVEARVPGAGSPDGAGSPVSVGPLDGAAPIAPLVLDLTPVRGLPIVPERGPAALAVVEPEVPPLSALLRAVMASGGLVLTALFFLPWRGASSWQLLETLAGADFVRQLYFLAGGVVLLVNALVPVPIVFRATVGAIVASVPLVLGAEGLLDGWRGLVATVAVVVLPATQLLRTRSGRAPEGLARGLVLIAASLIALVYLVPISSVVPLVYVGRLLASGSVISTVVGLFISIPLILSALSLLGALGRDLNSAAVLLAVLSLLWVPAAVVMFVDDGTQLYVAPALLWTSATAALCIAQLLSLAARKAQARA